MECDRARAAQAAAEELAAGFERRRDEVADAMSRAEEAGERSAAAREAVHRLHVEELEEELGAARGRAAALGHAMWGHGMRPHDLQADAARALDEVIHGDGDGSTRDGDTTTTTSGGGGSGGASGGGGFSGFNNSLLHSNSRNSDNSVPFTPRSAARPAPWVGNDATGALTPTSRSRFAPALASRMAEAEMTPTASTAGAGATLRGDTLSGDGGPADRHPASGSKTPLTESIRQMTATAGGISFAKLQASVQEAAVRRRSSAAHGPGAGGVSPELAALRKSLATLGGGSAQKGALKTAAAPPPAAVSSSSRPLHAAPMTEPATAARAVARHAAAPSAAPSAASPGGRVLAGVLSMTAQMTVVDSTPSPPPRLKRSRIGAGAGTPKAVTFAFGADAENAPPPPPPPASSFSGLSKAGLAAAGSGGAAGGAENTAPPGSTGKGLRDRTSTGSAGSGGGGGGGLRMSETRMATRRRALKALQSHSVSAS